MSCANWTTVLVAQEDHMTLGGVRTYRRAKALSNDRRVILGLSVIRLIMELEVNFTG